MSLDTVIFYTLQISGTGSVWRIMKSVNRGHRIERAVGDERFREGSAFTFDWADVPAKGQMLFVNAHYDLKPIENLDGQKFLINFRDPRDRICNEFAWNLVHPHSADETKEQIEARAEKFRAIGLQSWLRHHVGSKPLTDKDYYQYFIRNIDRIPEQNILVNSYARLCLDFDSFVERCCDVLDVNLTAKIKQSVEKERTEQLVQNPSWMGHYWNGSDIAPGRYKQELDSDSIAFLSKHYAPILRAMARLDPDYAQLYLENVDDAWGRDPFPPTLTFFGRDQARAAAPEAVPRPARPKSFAVPVVADPRTRHGVVRHTVVDRADLRIDHIRSMARHETVVFTFTERGNRDLEGSGFGADFLLKNGFDIVAIKTNRDMWYENLLENDIVEIERWLSWANRSYRQRLGFGSDMGAYAAIRCSDVLQFDRVLAFSPLFDIKQDWDTRWQEDLPAMSVDVDMFELPAGDHSESAASQISDRCEYMMVFDPLDRDADHIERFQQLIPADRLKLLALPYSGHTTAQQLAQLKVLGKVSLTAFKEGNFIEIATIKRRSKLQSTLYLFHLARHCQRRRHFAWSFAICQRILEITKDPDVEVLAGKALAQMGRCEQALEAIDRALAAKTLSSRRSVEMYRGELADKLAAGASAKE